MVLSLANACPMLGRWFELGLANTWSMLDQRLDNTWPMLNPDLDSQCVERVLNLISAFIL